MTCKQVTSSPPPPILGLSHALLGSAASMDSVNSFGRFEDGVDIAHLRQDTECHDDDNNPSCPITRLGFDCLALSPEQHETHHSKAIKWSRSSFQSIKIFDL